LENSNWPNLHAHEELLVLLTYVEPTIQEIDRIRFVFKEVKDWISFTKLAHFNKTLPLSFYQFHEYGLWDQLPTETQIEIETVALTVKKQNEARITESIKFLARFKEAGIPVAFLKGIALAEVVYRNPYYKRMNDVDLLIHKTDLKNIFEIYHSLNYVGIQEPTSGGAEINKNDPVSFVAPVYISSDLKCVIGTQWGIKSPATGYRINYPALWSRMIPLPFHGLELSMLSPEDGLHHLCLHLGYLKISVRDIMDIYNLIVHFRGQFDWSLFRKVVAETGSENPVYFALSLSQTWRPIPEVATFIQDLKPKISKTYIYGTQKKIQDPEILLRLSTDYFQSVEKSVIRFNSEGFFSKKFNAYFLIWKNLLFPPAADIAKICVLRPESSFLSWLGARLAAPYWIFWVIASEIGWTFVFLLILKLNMDLLVSIWSRPTQTYAEKLGVSQDFLEKLQGHFE
jgi:hypothetical protein